MWIRYWNFHNFEHKFRASGLIEHMARLSIMRWRLLRRIYGSELDSRCFGDAATEAKSLNPGNILQHSTNCDRPRSDVCAFCRGPAYSVLFCTLHLQASWTWLSRFGYSTFSMSTKFGKKSRLEMDAPSFWFLDSVQVFHDLRKLSEIAVTWKVVQVQREEYMAWVILSGEISAEAWNWM